jgi:hypothetical protein
MSRFVRPAAQLGRSKHRPDAVASSLHLSRMGAAPTKGMLTSRLVEVTGVPKVYLDCRP